MKKVFICIFLLIITILLCIKIYDNKTIKILNSEITRLNEENNKLNKKFDLIKKDNTKNTSNIAEMEEIIKSLNETIDEISKLKDRKPIQDTFPIDIKLSKCIEYSKNNSQTYDCQYIAKEDWKKDMNKSLASLKKKMKDEDYKILLDSQKKWEISKNTTMELMDKYTEKPSGIVNEIIIQSEESNIYKNRALFLNSLKLFINNYYFADEFKE